MKLLYELRRRHVFRTLGLYVVGAWLVFQVASTFFPAWNIPDAALIYLLYGAVVGFPIVAVFGWFYDLTPEGIARTPAQGADEEADYSLKRTDYTILAALSIVAIAVVYGSFIKVQETADELEFASSKPDNSIAVLPFENLDEDPDTAFFSDGVTEEILHHLSRFKSLAVMGRSSSFAFRSSSYTVPRISNLLSVRYVLQGTVRRDANKVRVTANLLDERGFQVWSETFDRELEGIFSIQTDIANRVAKQLNDEIVPASAPVGATSQSAEAYRYYLAGRDHSNKRKAGWSDSAAEAFQRAIELDPEFAAPYAGLAISTLLASKWTPEKSAEGIDIAQGYIDKALSIDPDLADAHAVQGLLLTFGLDPDLEAAEAALRRALDLDPNFMNAYNWLAIAVGSQGRREEATAIRRRALEIDPLNVIISANLANEYWGQGDFHRAREQLVRLMDLPTQPGTVLISLQTLHQEFGRYVEANKWAKERARAYLPSGDTWSLAALGNHYQYLGMTELADYWLAISIEENPDSLNAFLRRAYVAKIKGDARQMRELIDSYESRGLLDIDKIPVFLAEVIGGTKILAGDYEGGIEVIESAVDIDKPLSTSSGGGTDALDFLHAAAYGYRQTGNEEKALDILDKVAAHIRSYQDEGGARSPKMLELLALNHAMRGNSKDAVHTFELAIESGWRGYVYIENDLRWQDFLQEPAVKSSIAFVKSDLERQRKLVEAIEAEQDFKAEVNALIAELESVSENR
jgi:TolB-like protein/tetratricopeptide (TPR) repeat protein